MDGVTLPLIWHTMAYTQVSRWLGVRVRWRLNWLFDWELRERLAKKGWSANAFPRCPITLCHCILSISTGKGLLLLQSVVEAKCLTRRKTCNAARSFSAGCGILQNGSWNRSVAHFLNQCWLMDPPTFLFVFRERRFSYSRPHERTVRTKNLILLCGTPS